MQSQPFGLTLHTANGSPGNKSPKSLGSIFTGFVRGAWAALAAQLRLPDAEAECYIKRYGEARGTFFNRATAANTSLPLGVGSSHMAVGQNQWHHFGVGAPPILVYLSRDWDVHWGYGLLTHGHMASSLYLESIKCQSARRSPHTLGLTNPSFHFSVFFLGVLVQLRNHGVLCGFIACVVWPLNKQVAHVEVASLGSPVPFLQQPWKLT